MEPVVAERSAAVGGMNDRVVWEVLTWAALIAGAFALSFSFDDPLPHYPPGAALWPRIIQAVMTVAAIVLLVSRFLPQTVLEEQAKAPEHLDEIPEDLAGAPLVGPDGPTVRLHVYGKTWDLAPSRYETIW